jgi:hypothetical protein
MSRYTIEEENKIKQLITLYGTSEPDDLVDLMKSDIMMITGLVSMEQEREINQKHNYSRVGIGCK